MRIWGEEWGCVEDSRYCMKEIEKWHSCNVYVSSFVAVSRRCAPGLREMATGQVGQVRRVGIVCALYYEKNQCVHHKYRQEFMDCNLSIESVNGAACIEKILKKHPGRSFMAQAMFHPNAFIMQLYFHALMFFRERFATKLGSTLRNSNSSVPLGYRFK